MTNDVSTCRVSIMCFSDMIITAEELEDPHIKANCLKILMQNANMMFSSLLANLGSSDVSQEIKPDLFSCITSLIWGSIDSSNSLNNSFLDATCNVTAEAAGVQEMEIQDEEDLLWLDRLDCALVDLWDVMTMLPGDSSNKLKNILTTILWMLMCVTKSQFSSDQLIKSSVLLLRDLGVGLGPEIAKKVGETARVKCRSLLNRL